MFESWLIQMLSPRDIVIYWPGPRAFSVVQKPWGWAHISVQKPRGAQGMVTGEIDTCITEYQSMALLYDRVLRHKEVKVNKLDTIWNWSFNTPCKSLKGILALFEEEQPYTRDTSKFYNPKIEKVSVTVEGKPNQLYAQGMRSFEQYDKTRKYFAEGKQKDNNADEVQKHLQLYDLSAGEYLDNKYALWLDFRTIDENSLHGTGRQIENALEGITLQIKKKAESARDLNAFIYLIMDAQLNIQNGVYVSAFY